MADAAFDMLGDQQDMSNQPVAAPPGAIPQGAPMAITGDQHPLATDDSYEGRFGTVLRALDSRVQQTRQAAVASQQAAAATDAAAKAAAARHVAVMTDAQRRMAGDVGEPTGALGSANDNPQGKPGALPGNQPMSLQQYLDSHDDDTYKQASDLVKQRHGASPAELYDKMIDDKFITPADKPLTDRQKGEAFMHMGLEMLKHSTAKPGQLNLVGALGEAGEAGLSDVHRDHQEAANAAHEDYLRTQGLKLDQAKQAAADQKDEDIAMRQIQGDRVKNSESWRQAQFTQEQENARNAASNAARVQAAKTKDTDKNVQISKDSEGYQLERDPRTNQWVQSLRPQPVLDASGQPQLGRDGKPLMKPQPFKTLDETKLQDTEAARAQKAQTEETNKRATFIEGAKKNFATAINPQTHRPYTDEELGAQYDKLHGKNQTGLKTAPPAPGTVEDGYRFKGGDSSKRENWEKVS